MSIEFDDWDKKWMARALELGCRGLGLTAPNPPVGCVLVADNQIVGEGWHRRDGGPHAEVEALSDTNKRGQLSQLAEATAYVSLEPCSSKGRTGACALALIQAGVKRVIWSVDDPNPDHCGRASAVFTEAGVVSASGLLEVEGRELLSGYLSVSERGRPEVILKTGQSLDGRVVRRPGESSWLTGAQARYRVQQLRSEVDAILVGGATLRSDDPALTLRIPHRFGVKAQPWRIVLTQSGELPPDSRLFTDKFADRTLVICIGKYCKPTHNTRNVSFSTTTGAVKWLSGELGVQRLLVEAGGGLSASLLEQDLVDQWWSFSTGWVVGEGQSSVMADWTNSRRFELIDFEQVGEDLLSRWQPHGQKESKPAVFFDRDGVVNQAGKHYYITQWSDFEFTKGIIEALRAARQRGYALVLVTSQKGVGKGLMSQRDLDEIHEQMQVELAKQGLAFDRIEAFTGSEDWELGAKPQPDMVFSAVEALGIDLGHSWVIGDADRDIAMGQAAGCRTVRVGGGKDDATVPEYRVESTGELAGLLEHILDTPSA